jgi:hypothetical protein
MGTKQLWITVFAVSSFGYECCSPLSAEKLSLGANAYEFARTNGSYGAASSLDTIRRRIKDIVGEPLSSCGFSDTRFAAIRAHFRSLGYL